MFPGIRFLGSIMDYFWKLWLGQSLTLSADIARALSFNRDYIDIYSNSWGSTDNGSALAGPEPVEQRAFLDGVKLVSMLDTLYLFPAEKNKTPSQT